MATKQIKTCDVYGTPARNTHTYRIRIERQDGERWTDACPPKVVDLSPKALSRARSFIARASLPPDTSAEDAKKTIEPATPVADVPGQEFIPGCKPA